MVREEQCVKIGRDIERRVKPKCGLRELEVRIKQWVNMRTIKSL